MKYANYLGIPAEITGIIYAAVAVAAVLILYGIFFLSRYKRCPSDKIMVIYGKVSNRQGQQISSRCIHGGATFIWPIIQAYAFLDLAPISIAINLTGTLTLDNISLKMPCRFTVAISTEQGVMQCAAERLLRLKQDEIQALAEDIIYGQLRVVIRQTEIDEIIKDRDKFLEAVSRNVETELKKIGLRLINVNITDIDDEDGYIKTVRRAIAEKKTEEAIRRISEF